MAEVIGVRFRKTGKIYYFDPSGLELEEGWVVVETAQGTECAELVMKKRQVPDEQITAPLKKVLRQATREDEERMAEREKKQVEAMRVCQEKIAAHGLEMKLIDVEISFDGSKMVFYFTADGRVDFRELVKDLARAFRTRIELRQIGVRDEAKMMGGLGPCGRECCCRAYLKEFQPVSIRMAKEQNLSLNPTKISGLCGRLMCCLKYEQSTYEAARKKMPKPGKEIQTPDGMGLLLENNLLRETCKVRVALPDGLIEIRTYPLEDIQRSIQGLPPIDRTKPTLEEMPEVTLRSERNGRAGGYETKGQPGARPQRSPRVNHVQRRDGGEQERQNVDASATGKAQGRGAERQQNANRQQSAGGRRPPAEGKQQGQSKQQGQQSKQSQGGEHSGQSKARRRRGSRGGRGRGRGKTPGANGGQRPAN
ncbi:MAG: PSP1 domain-containing protein [Christensenellales bacterium]|jgi:cell fate regulator YaaT (PSP1 superfamily)